MNKELSKQLKMEMEYAYKRLERENKNQLLEVNKLRKKLTILENKVNIHN